MSAEKFHTHDYVQLYLNELQVSNPHFDPARLNNRGVERNKVIEKKSIALIGIPDAFCNEETLGSQEFFGQYGKII